MVARFVAAHHRCNMSNRIMKIVDWFIPHTPMHDRAELGRARIFVFSHLVGPTFSQAISAFLFFTDLSPGFCLLDYCLRHLCILDSAVHTSTNWQSFSGCVLV